MNGDGERLLAMARSFAFPRRSGSEGSRRVVEMLGQRLDELGFDVSCETFSFDLAPVERLLRSTLASGGCLIAASGWLAVGFPLWSLLLSIVVILGGGLLLGWSPWLEGLYRRPGPTRTANVVGRKRRTEPGGRLVLLAHHDSKSQSLALPARMAATLGTVGGVLGVVAVAGLEIGCSWSPPSWLGPAVGVTGGASLIALATMTSGNLSPGGVDNAGSLAIVLEVVSRCRGLLDDLDLTVLFTGAEEDHMVGAMRWLDGHADELTDCPTLALNFDGAGSPGRTVLITRFGLGRRFAPGLERLAVETARERNLPVRRIIMAPAVGIDAIPFAHRGIECLSISSGSLGTATYSVHSAGDVADNLDGPTMARIADYASALVAAVAAEFTLSSGANCRD